MVHFEKSPQGEGVMVILDIMHGVSYIFPPLPSKRTVHSVVKDWKNRKVILLSSVIDTHLSTHGHADSVGYTDILRGELCNPESVVESKTRKDTNIANIKLRRQNHNYLHVVIRYQNVLLKALGKKNYIVTFYGTDKPKGGNRIWPPQR